MSIAYLVKTTSGIIHDATGPDKEVYNVNEDVVIQTDNYKDCGKVVKSYADENKSGKGGDKKKRNSGKAARILRYSTEDDRGKVRDNDERQRSMFQTARSRIGYYCLPMKLLKCHITLDRSVAVFLFSAEERVDFRELVKDLSQSLHIRIELRQVGVRDESAILGGIGVCGRPYCCATVLHEFASVNVKTAKTQRLSLSPSTVSGACGRLKCCLRYEVEGYKELTRGLPRNGAFVSSPKGFGHVVDANPLTQLVRIRLDADMAQIVELSSDQLERADKNKVRQQQNAEMEERERNRKEREEKRRNSRSKNGGEKSDHKGDDKRDAPKEGETADKDKSNERSSGGESDERRSRKDEDGKHNDGKQRSENDRKDQPGPDGKKNRSGNKGSGGNRRGRRSSRGGKKGGGDRQSKGQNNSGGDGL